MGLLVGSATKEVCVLDLCEDKKRRQPKKLKGLFSKFYCLDGRYLEKVHQDRQIFHRLLHLLKKKKENMLPALIQPQFLQEYACNPSFRCPTFCQFYSSSILSQKPTVLKKNMKKRGIFMESMQLKKIEEYCQNLAMDAGKEIMEVYNNPDLFSEMEEKGDKSPLTLADKRANDLIVSGLRGTFPDFAILSEEEKDDGLRRKNPLCFIVDPLDGTKEFIKRNGQFTVNIGLAEAGKVIMGVIFVPVTGDLYYASQNNGSFYRNPKGEEIACRVSSQVGLDQPEKIRLVMSASHGAPEMETLIKKHNFTRFVKMGSSLKGCLVAKGEAEIYYRHGLTCEWDTAAMQCIVEEAGGIFRQMDGTEMRYNRENTLNEKGFYIINHEKNALF